MKVLFFIFHTLTGEKKKTTIFYLLLHVVSLPFSLNFTLAIDKVIQKVDLNFHIDVDRLSHAFYSL